ncbi:MAG: hypothetical protein PUF72_04910 [Clostridiales bacterium]|nr:hypothetical protein [Clostridiales bacterium]
MKFYEVPTMNISDFEIENILTDSAIKKAEAALIAAGVTTGTVEITNLTDWNKITE